MINLLPLEEKQKLFFKKKEKLAILLGFVVLVFLVCLVLILLSIKFYILAEVGYQKNILEQTKRENQIVNSSNLSSVVQKYNEVLDQLNLFYEKEIYFNKALKNILDIPRPKNLYFTNFFLKRDEKGNVEVSVSGTSDTRDDLLIFKKNIEEQSEIYPEIRNPSFSPESWINSKNAKFSLKAEIYQNEK